jgi:PD-(D/E)XK nuclease superfamily protein
MRSLPVYRPLYPSASKLALAAQCQAPWSRGYRRAPREVEGSAWGSLVHAGAEGLARGEALDAVITRYPPLFDVWEPFADRFAQAMRLVEEELGADRAAAAAPLFVELGIAYNSRSGIARLLDREPGQELQGEFCGTVDLAYMRADGVIVVVDWKTGQQSARLDVAEEHYQLWGLAVMLLRHFGVALASLPTDTVVASVELRHVGDDAVEIDPADITAGDALLFEYDMSELAQRIDGAAPPVYGDHCERLWCPARDACPAYEAQALAVAGEASAALPVGLLRRMAASPAEATAQWLALQAIRSASPLLEEHLRAYVLAHGPLVVGPGVELRAAVPKGGRLLTTPEALDIVEAVVPGAVREERQRKCTLEDVDAAAVRPHAERLAALKSSSDRKKARVALERDARAKLAERGVLGGGKLGVRLVRARHTLSGDWAEEPVGGEE